MTKVRAVFNVVGYRADDETIMYADRGDEFELEGEQLERLLELGAVEDASEPASDPPLARPIGELSHDELKARAKAMGVKATGGAKATKDDLIRAITEHDPHAGNPATEEGVAAPIEPDAVAPGVDVDNLTTPALDPIGDGKADQSELGEGDPKAARDEPVTDQGNEERESRESRRRRGHP